MTTKLSRRKIAEYVADRIVNEESPDDLLDAVAAYLVESRRTREAQLVVRAIEDALEQRDLVIVSAESARRLTSDDKSMITSLIKGKVLLRERVDTSLLGGVRLRTPSARLDASLRSRLDRLKGAMV